MSEFCSDSRAPSQPRRNVRPNFADDVYGEKKSSSTNEDVEYSESSLAQRRSAVLPKLKQLKEAPMLNADALPRPESVDISERDLDFEYTDSDSLTAELAELYSYSELDDFASNVVCWRVYADEIKLERPFNYHILPISKKQAILLDLCSRMESAESDVRLTSSKIMLYLLQGAYVDFGEEDEMEAGVPPKGPTEKGTGGFEGECIQRACRTAHLAYSSGVYQALCTLLLVEICEPFDNGMSGGGDGRDSKASSRDSRSASNIDLADNERRCRRSATMADNEALRVVLSALYHMVELMRFTPTVDKLGEDSKNAVRRAAFIEELEEPIDNAGQSLIYVLFEMMPPFYGGSSPHFPMKKVLLLSWKILLLVLGGWDELDAEKRAKRVSAGLEPMENTLKVARNMSATVINDGESGVRMAAKRSMPSVRMMARQLAYAGSDEGKDDDEIDVEPAMPSADEQPSNEDSIESAVTKRADRQASGDRTPRAGSPMPIDPPRKSLPWKSKVSKDEVEVYIQQERSKFFSYQLPGDMTTLFGLPPPILASIKILNKNIYTPLGELQATQEEDLNRYLFSMKENIEDNKRERLYKMLLPSLSQYTVALLKVLLAAAPSNKAKNDALNILVDVLTPETDGSDVLCNSISLDHSTSSPLEDSVRLTIDINRHKEIMVKATSSILILLIKHFKLNHIYQYEYLCQHVVFGNGIPLLLKFLDQNMIRYVQSRHEIHAYNYPQAPLYYVRNGEEWPVLNPDNVEDGGARDHSHAYFMWRNVFSSINLIRVLNKLVKAKQFRVMMLMVFKSAPILKRSLKIRLGIFQLYVLKALKMQSRYLGRQWRKNNMDVMSAIYSKVRHRLTDDWAFANEIKKSYDYHNEESELKACVERFHSRRYAKLYPQLAIEVNDAPMPGDDYLNRVDLREFEPVDNCTHSVLGIQPELGERFKRNYSKWVEEEVIRREIDWDKLLLSSKGLSIAPV